MISLLLITIFINNHLDIYLYYTILLLLEYIFINNHLISYPCPKSTNVHWSICIIFISTHLISYPCPRSTSIHWGIGIIAGTTVCIQVLTGTLLGIHYTPGIYSAYYSVVHIYREVYYGSLYRYVHSSVASPVFTTVCTHPYRGIFHGSYWYVYGVMWVGVAVFIVLMATAFMGYVLPWGQMSYWGATVITNLLSSIPCMVPWVCGGFYISQPTISRYFIIHSTLPVSMTGLLVFHVLYLHRLSSSSNPGYGTNNRIHFYTWLVHKDTLALVSGIVVINTQVSYGVIMLAHPDNTLEVSVLYTPMHIVPE